MSVRAQHSDELLLHFITFTCLDLLPLFKLTNSYDLVYKWFNYLKEEKKVSVTAYVIMPNHLHCILFFPSKGFSLNAIIANAKRFMAYEMIQRLKIQEQFDLLTKMTNALSENEKKKNQQHKVSKTVLMLSQSQVKSS